MPAGATQTVKFTFAPRGRRVRRVHDGKLVLTGNKGHTVRIPVTVQPEPLVADDEVCGVVPSARSTVEGTAGFTGDVDLAVGSGRVDAGGEDLEAGGFDPDDPEADADTFQYDVEVPAGAPVEVPCRR